MDTTTAMYLYVKIILDSEYKILYYTIRRAHIATVRIREETLVSQANQLSVPHSKSSMAISGQLLQLVESRGV